ncbi:MDR family MFS transporter [Paenibacillus hamazuiensis]|uniref:MDR family MFS transporter n=1 Tax=Paenibacillus hamazuiensis TaxID=2936508 RepID=UPI00200F8B69|nr:MDR family MFS transporter [Paenibacillus hamazuiensis]
MLAKKTNRGIVTLGLLAALFVGALDAMVVSTAMPRITTELQGLSLISWIFSIYTLTTCVATPIFGKLADLYGRRSVFTIGLALFVLGSILCGAAQSMPQLIWFRAIQGIGAGALTPVTFTIIGDLYPGEQRAKIQGVFSSVWSVAGLLGPLVGGYFVDQLTWRWIFYMNVPVGIISFVLVFGFLHEQFEKKKKSIDYLGAVTFTVGITSLMYALLNIGESGAVSPTLIAVLFAVAAIFLALFLGVERRAKEPMLPLVLFKNRMLTIPYAMSFIGFTITAGVTIYLPLWIQELLGESATSSGLTLMPMSIAWPIAANITGRYMFKLGPKRFIVGGAILVVLGAIWLWTVGLGTPAWQLAVIISIIGFGMGCMTTPAMVLIQTSVGWQMRGVATATNSFMNTFGQTVGVAVYGMLFNSVVSGGQTAAALAGGMHLVFGVVLLLSVINLVTVCFLPAKQQSPDQQPVQSGAAAG